MLVSMSMREANKAIVTDKRVADSKKTSDSKSSRQQEQPTMLHCRSFSCVFPPSSLRLLASLPEIIVREDEFLIHS